MKRAILLLTTALLGTGCHSHSCNNGTLTVFWTFSSASGGSLDCTAAGVDTVDVAINGAPQGTFPCRGPNSDGITLLDFVSGTYDVQLDGFDSANHHIFQSTGNSVGVNGCQDNSVSIEAAPLTGDLTLTYEFTPTNQCTTPTSVVWYELVDASNNVVDVVDATHTPNAVPCGTNPVLAGLPFGFYTVTRIQELDPANGGAISHATCSPQQFFHAVAGEQSPLIQVPESPNSCF